ncbi:MAG: hypothetical protein ACREFP_11125 [Acetobacteraceae bacterium]
MIAPAFRFTIEVDRFGCWTSRAEGEIGGDVTLEALIARLPEYCLQYRHRLVIDGEVVAEAEPEGRNRGPACLCLFALASVLLLAGAGAARAAGAPETLFYGPGGQPQGRLVETPDGRSATLYAPNGRTERTYRRVPDGWAVFGPGGVPEGRAATVPRRGQ